jgi:hypothetical protein
VLQVDADARPRRGSAAHGVNENVCRLQMRCRVRMTRFPPLESRERIIFSQRAGDL